MSQGLRAFQLTDASQDKTVEMKYPVDGSAKAWANLNGTGTIALRDSLNVAGEVDNGTGDYTFNLTSSMLNNNGIGTCDGSNGTEGSTGQAGVYDVNVSSYSVATKSGAGTSNDRSVVYSLIHGDLA